MQYSVPQREVVLGFAFERRRQFENEPEPVGRLTKTSWRNDFTADAKLALTHGGDEQTEKRGLSANLTWQIDDQLRLEIEATGQWQGGLADIEAAKEAVAAHGSTVDPDVLTLIDQRATPDNQLTSHQVTIDFRQEVTKHFNLIAELTAGFEATIGRRALSASGKLSNVFDWSRQTTGQGRFALLVSFDRGEQTVS